MTKPERERELKETKEIIKETDNWVRIETPDVVINVGSPKEKLKVVQKVAEDLLNRCNKRVDKYVS